jgi:hypothetical protein
VRQGESERKKLATKFAFSFILILARRRSRKYTDWKTAGGESSQRRLTLSYSDETNTFGTGGGFVFVFFYFATFAIEPDSLVECSSARRAKVSKGLREQIGLPRFYQGELFDLFRQCFAPGVVRTRTH